jgi:M6 family metalloprotease-like protein
LTPSDFIATDIEKRDFTVLSFLNTIEQKLWFSEAQKQIMLQVWQIEDEITAMHNAKGTSAVTGNYKALCALVQFPEKSFEKTLSQFDALFNQLGYTGNGTGSVRDFFKETSYNQFDFQVSLFGIYTAPKSEAYYAGSSGLDNCPELAQWLAQQVAAEPGINFAEYTDETNKVNFHFIFAGMGSEFGAIPELIWSHKWQFSPPVYQGNYFISVYSCSPEILYGSTISAIGVICHEMSHAVLKVPDFYDTSGSYEGTGDWDLMAGGSWNGYPRENCPAHHNMFAKSQVGWITPVVLNTQTTITDMPNSAENPVAYRINTPTNNEYYLLENRQRIKFDSYLPGEGLIIYHVHSDVNSGCTNCAHPQKMYPVCASSTVAIPTGGSSSYGYINSAGCPFPGTSSKTEFHGTTTPTMFYWPNNEIHDNAITEITMSEQLVSFKFMDGIITQYTLNVIANPSYGGTVSGAGTYMANSSVTVTAEANTGYSFANWTKNGTQVSTEPVYTFDITDDIDLVANFNEANLIDNYRAKMIKIFPNPADSYVNIVSETNINDIIIFDSFGKKIREVTNIAEKSYQLDIKDLPRSIYYLQIDGATLKLVVTD